MSLAVTVRLDRFRMNRGLPQQKEICYAQVPRHSISRRLHRSCVTGCFRIRHFPGNGLGTVVNSSAQLGALVNSSAQLGALVVEPFGGYQIYEIGLAECLYAL
jgi:hypothetical protein